MKIHLNCRRTIVSSLLAATFFPTLVSASGFALIETNARGQGNAYAGAAAHTPDASTIFFNPAGMLDLGSDQLVIAAHIVRPKSNFKNEGSSNAESLGSTPISGGSDDGGFDAFVPNLYWVKGIDESMKFGFGINSPFGLAIKYDDTWVGRYHAVVSDLKIINFNPSLAYKVNEQLAIGGGLNMMTADVTLSSAVDFAAVLGQTPNSDDGFVELTGDNYSDLGFGLNLGLNYQIDDATRLGVAYRSETKINVEGDADFTVPASASLLVANGQFIDTGLKAGITLPASLSMSVAHQQDKLTYLADITWTGWSSFDELRVEFDNENQPDAVTTYEWNDTMRYSLGVDYQYQDNMILRAGVALDETPVPSAERRTPRLPGNDRTWLSLGMSYTIDDEFSLDVGYSHLFFDDTQVNNELESSASDNVKATLSGTYEASVDILSVQLNWKY
jgi:long-chain fatty acid transport protein